MKLWSPSPDRIREANITAFTAQVAEQLKLNFEHAHALYDWSVSYPQQFWEQFWSFAKPIHSQKYSAVLENSVRMPGAKWFNGSKLNFAENLLKYRDDRTALIFCAEGFYRRELSYADLYSQVATLAQNLRKMGVKRGDRIAGYMPNMPETIVAMLATTSIGAVWTSCSPDFGVAGVVDRFAQVNPKVLFCADGYFFKGQSIDSLTKVAEIKAQISSIEQIIVTPYTRTATELKLASPYHQFYSAIESSTAQDPPPLDFEQLPFDHPLYIMYSSGTTGKPKCIVHSTGGVLIEHLKELLLHTDLKREDRIFYQTTCGWMMWNWLVSSLAVGATVVLFDGAPLHQKGEILIDLVERERITIFGTNAKYLSAIEKLGITPIETHELTALRTILSTGSPLAPESFDYVYRNIKQDVCLSSIAGGTDILGCFAIGCPTLPVYRGELQMRSLALKVEVFDSKGTSIKEQKGELVCSAPFPSMPIGFWNDPEDAKYKKAYFSVFPNVWHHGDYVELTKHNGMIYHGRSDAVLNPGGVRIGTAEIYNQVEKLPEILESLAIGQDWEGDVRVVLFVRLQEGLNLEHALINKIKTQIRSNASPFHVPAKIIQVADIPRTRSGKIVELAVRDLIHGRAVTNREALANPEALELFANLKELQS